MERIIDWPREVHRLQEQIKIHRLQEQINWLQEQINWLQTQLLAALRERDEAKDTVHKLRLKHFDFEVKK